MSIFLALIFQVLFVFFAMVINIGLLVHDKINLQNSVDLGAYYAAQKQAEILNEIAHLNYQIRQDYKLLAWRYWVLGTLGRDRQGADPPPARRPPGNAAPDGIRRYSPTGAASSQQEEVPVACLANLNWWEFARVAASTPNENYCHLPYLWTSREIPMPSIPLTPATAAAGIFARMLTQTSRADYVLSCEQASPLSWTFVAAIIAEYKASIAYKKKAIKRLRANLISADPVDGAGQSIRAGVIATIRKNLTESNLASFDASQVQILNGLSRGQCGTDSGRFFLPEIHTAPGLYFANLQGVGSVCSFDIRFQTDFSVINGPLLNQWDPTGFLRNRVGGEPGFDDDEHSSLGFEKNPWCMAYVGVKARTSPRKPFAPFGQAVDLVARAFAQPFGGRIGPWYSKRWTRGSATSNTVGQPTVGAGAPASQSMNPTPSQTNDRTDPLTSPRIAPGTSGFQYSGFSIPNFSRFPGDPLGLRSQLTQSIGRSYFAAIATSGVPAGPIATDRRVRLNWFFGVGSITADADTLAYDPTQATLPPFLAQFRQLEKAAVAPDLFDVTYYSVDPAADKNYVARVRSNPALYSISPPHAPMGDLGSRESVPGLQGINVESQIDDSNQLLAVDSSLQVYWKIRDWRHLLTGWAPHRAASFIFPSERFGQCNSEAFPNFMIPGKCTAGGRVGYSVRLVSREHLNGTWQVGGGTDANREQPGPLLNAPGGDNDF